MTFAAKTKVPAEKTRGEIEKLVVKHGATKFLSGWEQGSAAIIFDMKNRRIRFTLPMPERKKHRTERDFDQATRTAWRALFLIIKAKLEAVASGIGVFESEFLAHIVIPGTKGQTVGEWASPQIATAYAKGIGLPPLLPGASE